MARDVKIWKEDGAFKLRVCGVIEQDKKYLINNANECGFYGFPGGHVTLGEDTDTAVIREIKEETGIETKITRLIAIIQLFLKREDGKPFHEVCYYYLLSPVSKEKTESYVREEIDNGVLKRHEFNWIDLDYFDKIDLRPKEMKNLLEKGLERQHIILKED